MIEGILALFVAGGLVFAIFGAWHVMEATPIFGGDDQGSLSSNRTQDLATLEREQKRGWQLLLIGFALQLLGALGTAIVALCRWARP